MKQNECFSLILWRFKRKYTLTVQERWMDGWMGRWISGWMYKCFVVQFPVVYDPLWSHGWQYIRPLCPSPSSEDCPVSCPLYQWSHPAISSSGALFSFCPQSFPASGSFPMSPVICIRWSKYWSFRFSISPSNEYSGLISPKIDCYDLLEWMDG